MSEDALDRGLVGAVLRSIDEEKLRQELSRIGAIEPKREAVASGAEAKMHQEEVLKKIVMADLLDDAILAARPGEKPFPLRLFFGELGARLANDTAFALASGLNFYFRAEMEEEPKMRLGLEVSRLYYKHTDEIAMDAPARAQVSPLLATLMSSELSRLKLESVDHASMFDSASHERDEGSSPSSPAIHRPAAFLCRVPATGVVRAKAKVRT